MNDSDTIGKKAASITFVVMLVVILFAAVNQYAGSGVETTGVVLSVSGIPSDTGPIRQAANVRLANGETVVAQVFAPRPVNVGDAVDLRIHSRSISGNVYQVVGPATP